MYLVTRYDDVREVFLNDASFAVPYERKLRVITGGEPFFLGMPDGPKYRTALQTMQQVVRAADLPALGDGAERLARDLVRGQEQVEVVQLVRDVTFGLLAEYFGVPELPDRELQVWASRLFEFQFADQSDDPLLRTEVDTIAPALRRHIDDEIERRKAEDRAADDVLGRCIQQQKSNFRGYSDVEIRTAMLCMIVGGPPQPPMVVPNAMEQLLRRPAQLHAAEVAARADDDGLLRRIVFEAMRFDPLAPWLTRTATRDIRLAAGTARETLIMRGASVAAAFSSAMMDDRRIPYPRSFRTDRKAHEYMHFGHSLHECFGRHINHAILHRILKPLLQQGRVERTSGPLGKLLKNGAFAERLVVRLSRSPSDEGPLGAAGAGRAARAVQQRPTVGAS